MGIIAAVPGYSCLHGHATLVNSLMLFAAGGILYLMFQDIAPMIKYRRHWAPALGAALGFLLGMVGVKLLG